jgi:hypothetical protein
MNNHNKKKLLAAVKLRNVKSSTFHWIAIQLLYIHTYKVFVYLKNHMQFTLVFVRA